MRWLLLVLASATITAAERSPAAETWDALQRLHAEELIAFAAALDARDGSLEAEARAAAITLARRLDATVKPKDAAHKAMSADEQAADKSARAAATARAREREAAEQASPSAALPLPVDALERFAARRLEILRSEIVWAERLSADPERRVEATLRQAAGKDLLAELGSPRWAAEKALRERASALAAGKFMPWTGTWTTRLGTMTLAQAGDKVTGGWSRDPKSGEDGTLTGAAKERALTATWKTTTGESGTLTVTLSRDGARFAGSSKGKAGEPIPLEGERVDGDAR